MNPIYILVGAPAVGKSTTARFLATRFPKSIYIPVDDIRHMVVSGLALPGTHWSDELTRQISLARTSVAHMALAYQQAGYAVVLDDFWDANHDSDYQTLLDHPHLHRVILYPEQEEAHRRNLKRSGDSPDRTYIDEGIRLVYQMLNPVVAQLAGAGWQVVDSTHMSVETVVKTVMEHTPAAG